MGKYIINSEIFKNKEEITERCRQIIDKNKDKKKKLQQQIKEELTAANDIHSMLASAAVQGKWEVELWLNEDDKECGKGIEMKISSAKS